MKILRIWAIGNFVTGNFANFGLEQFLKKLENIHEQENFANLAIFAKISFTRKFPVRVLYTVSQTAYRSHRIIKQLSCHK